MTITKTNKENEKKVIGFTDLSLKNEQYPYLTAIIWDEGEIDVSPEPDNLSIHIYRDFDSIQREEERHFPTLNELTEALSLLFEGDDYLSIGALLYKTHGDIRFEICIDFINKALHKKPFRLYILRDFAEDLSGDIHFFKTMDEVRAFFKEHYNAEIKIPQSALAKLTKIKKEAEP